MSELVIMGPEVPGQDRWEGVVDFDDAQVEICTRTKNKRGWVGPLVTVPIGSILEETDDDDARIDGESEDARNLVLVLAAPLMLHVLRQVEERLAVREADESAAGAEWIKDMDLLRGVRAAINSATNTGGL
jgi:hypothetical protein